MIIAKVDGRTFMHLHMLIHLLTQEVLILVGKNPSHYILLKQTGTKQKDFFFNTKWRN